MPLMAEREPGVFVYENLERPPVLFPDGTQKNLGTVTIHIIIINENFDFHMFGGIWIWEKYKLIFGWVNG